MQRTPGVSASILYWKRFIAVTLAAQRHQSRPISSIRRTAVKPNRLPLTAQDRFLSCLNVIGTVPFIREQAPYRCLPPSHPRTLEYRTAVRSGKLRKQLTAYHSESNRPLLSPPTRFTYEKHTRDTKHPAMAGGRDGDLHRGSRVPISAGTGPGLAG